jgi:phosphoglycerol transferase
VQATAAPPAGSEPTEQVDDDTGPGAPPAAAGSGGDACDTPRWGRELAILTAVLCAVAAAVYRVWDRAWSTPFVHAGDAMAHLALLDTVGWTGTPAPNDRLGAPWGVDWVDMPTGADRLHLVALRGLRALTGDTVAAANAYLLLSIVVVGVASYVVIRRLRCSPLASGVAAVVIAVAPAHFARAAVGHLFLVNYVAVPLVVWLALWSTDGLGPDRRGASGRREWIVPCLLVVVVGSASAYYAAFGVVAIVSLGLVLALRRGSWRALVRPVAVAAGVSAVVVANVAGEVARRGGDAGVRVPLDSDAFGLRIAQMLLPVRDHRIGALADWSDRAYRVAAPGDRGAALGLAAVVGVAALVVWCVRRLGRPATSPDLLSGAVPGRPGVLARLGVLTLSVLAVGTVGGVGMVLATLGITQIRAWSRISIVVGFVGVTVLAMLLDGLASRWSVGRPLRWAGAAALVAIAVFDQFGTSSLPSPSYDEAKWSTDQQLAADLEQSLPDDAMVFQLPVGTYPAELPLGSISANDLLGPAVAGDGSLRWSVGAMSGRSGDWQRTVGALPVEQMTSDLAAADVAAIAVDRRGGEPAVIESLEEQLTEVLGGPAYVSQDGTRAWYDLRPLRARLVDERGQDEVERIGAAVTRPVGVVVEGSPGARSTRDPRARDLGPTAAIVLTDPSTDAADGPAPVVVTFTLDGAPGAVVELRLPDGAVRRVELTGTPVPVRLEVPFADGQSARVEVVTDAAPLPAPADDWGDLRVRLADLMVRDAGLAR